MVPTEQDVEMIIDFFHDMFATLSVQASKLWPASPSAACVHAQSTHFRSSSLLMRDATVMVAAGGGTDGSPAARAPLPALAAR